MSQELENKLKKFAPIPEKAKCAKHGWAIRVDDRFACPTYNMLINLSREADKKE